VTIRLPDPCLVVLVGPAGSGKSTYAATTFGAERVVSSDHLRATVGIDQHDQRASTDAFAVLELIVERRLRRGLATVIDSTALEDERRARYRELAAKAKVPCVAIAMDVDEKVARARNRARSSPVPTDVLSSQLKRYAEVRPALDGEGFDAVHDAGPAVLVPASLLAAPAAAARQRDAPVQLGFDLQIARWGVDGGPAAAREQLAEVALAAEQAGFGALWVMDHFVQIPHVGPEWDDMYESYTTLSYLAGVTRTIRLGALVTGVTYRNLAHLAKIVATLDVLSGGRAMCGLGAAWFAREHELYGWELPPVARRYDLLEDALELLPLMWGKGTPRFDGRTTTVPAAVCYPRPLQEHIPLLVGGSGERRTLALVARHADACNLFGEPDVVRHKVEVLHRHCASEGRDPATIMVTNLAQVPDGPLDDAIGRFRAYADAGVQRTVVGLPGGLDAAWVRAQAPLLDAFR
jgi:F420-dependent oxidoreductase-like protein